MDNKSADKLKKMVEAEVVSMFQAVLNYAEVACPTSNVYSKLRSKVLRLGNDCIRNIGKNVDRFYEVKFVPRTEDVIEIRQRRKGQYD